MKLREKTKGVLILIVSICLLLSAIIISVLFSAEVMSPETGVWLITYIVVAVIFGSVFLVEGVNKIDRK